MLRDSSQQRRNNSDRISSKTILRAQGQFEDVRDGMIRRCSFSKYCSTRELYRSVEIVAGPRKGISPFVFTLVFRNSAPSHSERLALSWDKSTRTASEWHEKCTALNEVTELVPITRRLLELPNDGETRLPLERVTDTSDNESSAFEESASLNCKIEKTPGRCSRIFAMSKVDKASGCFDNDMKYSFVPTIPEAFPSTLT
mmetsp:Transcript_11804/g.20142  ORF Transcript_11804/g.20142 Transcript_11804/m.20142 type:complete len:200 (+) Transcript_11804:1302-1901(+)